MELLGPLGSREHLDQLDRPGHKVRGATLDRKDRVGRQAVLVRKEPLELRDKEDRQVHLDRQVLTGPQVPSAPLGFQVRRVPQGTRDHQVSKDFRAQLEVRDH